MCVFLCIECVLSRLYYYLGLLQELLLSLQCTVHPNIHYVTMLHFYE